MSIPSDRAATVSAPADAGVDIPPGYRALRYSVGFGELFGPLYFCKREGAPPLIGLRIDSRHLNSGHTAHGGLLVSLADVALGFALSYYNRGGSYLTVSLTTNFVGTVRPGEWVHVESEVLKSGGNVAYANCSLLVGTKRVMHASGVFVPRTNRKADHDTTP